MTVRQRASVVAVPVGLALVCWVAGCPWSAPPVPDPPHSVSPAWEVREVGLPYFNASPVAAACLTADGRYAVVLSDICRVAVVDLTDPAVQPAERVLAGAVTLAPSADSQAVWVGYSDGRVGKFSPPSLQVAEAGRCGDERVMHLAELRHGYLLAVTGPPWRGCVLRPRPGRLDEVLTVPGAQDWTAAPAAGAAVVVLRRVTEDGDSATPVALHIGPRSVTADLGWPDLGLPVGRAVLVSSDGSRWVVPADHPQGEYHMRNTRGGPADVPLPLYGRLAIAPTRPDVLFAASDKHGVWVYDLGRREGRELVSADRLPAESWGVGAVAVSADASTCLIAFDGGVLLVLTRNAPLRK